MKSFLVLCLALCIAAVAANSVVLEELKIENDGHFHSRYETDDGVTSVQDGHLNKDGDKEAGEIIEGFFSYVDENGKKVEVTYKADQDGYHPQGDHLPTPPPIPDYILRSIEYNALHVKADNDKPNKN